MAEQIETIPDSSIEIGGRLEEISAAIDAAHKEAERSLRASVENAIRAGELLIEAKREVPHGAWTLWLQENITFSDRLAQAYMRLARLPLEKRNAVADLPLREALSAIGIRQRRLEAVEVVRNRDNAECRPQVNKTAHFADYTAVPVRYATPDEIADDLIRNLAEAFCEVSDKITIRDLRAAFDRWASAVSDAPVKAASESIH